MRNSQRIINDGKFEPFEQVGLLFLRPTLSVDRSCVHRKIRSEEHPIANSPICMKGTGTGAGIRENYRFTMLPAIFERVPCVYSTSWPSGGHQHAIFCLSNRFGMIKFFPEDVYKIEDFVRERLLSRIVRGVSGVSGILELTAWPHVVVQNHRQKSKPYVGDKTQFRTTYETLFGISQVVPVDVIPGFRCSSFAFQLVTRGNQWSKSHFGIGRGNAVAESLEQRLPTSSR